MAKLDRPISEANVTVKCAVKREAETPGRTHPPDPILPDPAPGPGPAIEPDPQPEPVPGPEVVPEPGPAEIPEPQPL